MAIRPIFITKTKQPFFEERYISFKYYNGFAVEQKQKSILSLHQAAEEVLPNLKVLEISSASPILLGKKLSAFNLTFLHKNKHTYTVESAFQASKIFEFGGPYTDLLTAPSAVAKRDCRVRESGRVIGFNFLGERFATKPTTLFYDWIYINALNQHKELHNEILNYNGFSDIEFNPKKSINCQARSVATFVSLKKQNLLQYALKTVEDFKILVYGENDIIDVGVQKCIFD